jgi:hypothetical protein
MKVAIATPEGEADRPGDPLARRAGAYIAAGARRTTGPDGFVSLDLEGGSTLHVSPSRWAEIEAEALAHATAAQSRKP